SEHCFAALAPHVAQARIGEDGTCGLHTEASFERGRVGVAGFGTLVDYISLQFLVINEVRSVVGRVGGR
ncbi:hypothetical protein PFISCL1PPCAC_23130, partial [Pristionchus fissidentatus]